MKYVSLNTVPTQSVSHNTAIHKQTMLEKGDLPHLIQFAQARFAPGQVASAHAHIDMHEVFFVQSGCGTMVINNQVHTLEPGACISVAPGEVHEVSNTGDEVLVLTYFGIAE
ncbi:cupin domain-containing protein [Oscillatoria sp. CS-180]|uniref:cupin domain-containing protein n=1 Tax=Oscillatoria sp. CS-180 TaxID=3021720 RepID=UPI00232D85D4|nr:cupin domain-containing protein [Oscillatoria sp. CS-180]MDB9525252.1 cupin domain-containing protein [Oscillatoria sp. CS-180]